jgi:hypothetical protein
MDFLALLLLVPLFSWAIFSAALVKTTTKLIPIVAPVQLAMMS